MENVIFAEFSNQVFREQATAESWLDIPPRIRQYAVLWRDGVPLRNQCKSDATFYRIRKQLLQHGVDASQPCNVMTLVRRVETVKVTPRRIRSLLAEARLEGRRQDNGLPLPLYHRHAWPRFKAFPAAKTRQTKGGIEGGMNTKFTLTGQEKIMNMVKLGTVSGARIDFNGRKILSKINRMRKSLYTLCVLDEG